VQIKYGALNVTEYLAVRNVKMARIMRVYVNVIQELTSMRNVVTLLEIPC